MQQNSFISACSQYPGMFWGSSCWSLYAEARRFIALGTFLPLGFILAVIICLFLAFLAVCDAAQRKSNVLTPTAVHLWARPPISSERARKTELIICQERMTHRQQRFAVPCFRQTICAPLCVLQRDATAGLRTFWLFIYVYIFCNSAVPCQRIRS